jgi:hypothetical protein
MDNILEKAKNAAGGLKDKISDFKDNIWGDDENQISEEFKDAGRNKIQDMLNYIESSNDLFTKSGFELIGLGVSLALTPVIVSTFQFNKKISDEEREVLLCESNDRKIIKLIMNCLFKANDFVDGIKVANYKLGTVAITLGLSPGINVTFKKQ